MVQNNNLHPAICTVDDVIEECEHLSHSHHIFILPFRLGRIGSRTFDPTRGKVNLTWLIVNKESGDRMMRQSKEVSLQCQSQSNVISEPIRSATNLPEVIVPRTSDNLYC